MPRYPSPADTEAMIARVAPSIIELLADGVPRSRRAIVDALADQYSREEVRHTLMRLAVSDRVAEVGGKYVLGTAEETDSE